MFERSEEAQELLDSISQRNVTNPDTKQNGAVLTATQYNLMNNMLIALGNLNNDNIKALQQFVLTYLPNFVKIVVGEESEGVFFEAPIVDGLLTLDLADFINTINNRFATATALASAVETLTTLVASTEEELSNDIANTASAQSTALSQAVQQLTSSINAVAPVALTASEVSSIFSGAAQTEVSKIGRAHV